MKLLRVVCIAFCLLVVGSAPAGAFPVSQVIVFGDSNVDNGNLRALFGPGVNPPPNFGGRNSNGIVVVEYLAAGLGVPLKDFAYSGATTGAPGLSPLIPNTLTQIQTYFGTLGGGMADPNALYIYWAGSNDILLATTPPGALQSKINGAVANIDTALRQLDAKGARHILVATRTPRPDLASVDNQNGIALNAAIKTLVLADDQQLAADIQIYDAYASIEDMVLNPAKYGFTQPTALCINNNPGSDNCANDLSVAAGYINWDAAHKTTRVHQIMAQQIIVQIPEPRTLALLVVAFGVLAWSRRRGYSAL
ncbi:MAG: SGNH/GDSL hydrolase family protein [Burkholderiales bacterium]|nr:SGNH/GDSL hydrolase family protein [Burkholderiales bacterium]